MRSNSRRLSAAFAMRVCSNQRSASDWSQTVSFNRSMAAIAGSGHPKGSRATYLAKSRIELFPGQSPAFARRCS